MINLFIDARFFKKKPDGVARYITEILYSLNEVGEFKFYFCSNKKIYIPDRLKNLDIETYEYNFFKFLPGTLFTLFVLPFFLLNKKGVFFGGGHAVPLFAMKSIVVIHDLVAFEFPDTMTFRGRILNKLSILLSSRYSNEIVSVSNITKNRIKSLLPRVYDKKEIHIVPNSVDRNVFFKIDFSKHNTKQLIGSKVENIVTTNFILSVSTLEPRKNLKILVKGFEELKKYKYYNGKLVLVGISGWKNSELYDIIENSKYRDDIIIPGYLPDEKINYLMNVCDAFVFPSLYEGFGIPPLEAYCAGARVLCSKYTEMNYMHLKNLYLFDPKKDVLKEKILEVLSEKKGQNDDYTKSWKDSSLILKNIIESQI